MMNLYGAQGMGTSGTGVGAGGNISLPQILAMLQSAHGGMPPIAGPGAGTPLAPSGPGSPMANYIGAGGGGMPGGGGGMAMPAVSAPQPAVMGANLGGGANSMDMMKLLMAMKGGQTGVTPQGGGSSGGAASQMAPGIGMPGLDSILRMFGMFGGATGGAPT